MKNLQKIPTRRIAALRRTGHPVVRILMRTYCVRQLLLLVALWAAIASSGCPRRDTPSAHEDVRPQPWSPTVAPPHDETVPPLLEHNRLYP